MTIYGDFISIQKKLPALVKNTQGAQGFKYPKLEQILDIVIPLCHDMGLGLSQITHPIDGGIGIETVLFNDKNERVSSGILAMPLTTDADGNIINVGNKNKQGQVSGQYGAQAYGSALTYARRYSLVAFFGMKAEDDDGYQASQKRMSKEEAEVADVYTAMTEVRTIEELRDVTLEIMEGKDKEKQKVFWNVALQVVRDKNWSEEVFKNMCKEARKQ